MATFFFHIKLLKFCLLIPTNVKAVGTCSAGTREHLIAYITSLHHLLLLSVVVLAVVELEEAFSSVISQFLS